MLLVTLLLSACSARLEVVKDGAGDGRVVSMPAGIDCGVTCSSSFSSGLPVTLTAAPDAGSFVAAWQGCDASSGPRCEVTVSGHRMVIPTFEVNPSAEHVRVVVDGRGVVSDAAIGFACEDSCVIVPDGSGALHLTAFAGPNAVFEAWSGACGGTNPSACSVGPGVDVVVTAMFASSTAAQLQPSILVASSCGDTPCAGGYESTVRLRNGDGGYRGVEFVVVSPTLRLMGVSLPPGLGGCFAAAGPDKVIVVCPDDHPIDDEDVAILSFERIVDGDGVLVLDDPFVVTDSGKERVSGAAVLVDGSL